VASHSNGVTPLAAGAKALCDGTQSFAHTQAMWRFPANERVTLPHLASPLVQATREGVGASCDEYALVVHDWSRLAFGSHKSKRDIKTLSHKADVGYDLATSLVVSDTTGEPIAAPLQNLVTREGLWTSCAVAVRRDVRPHLDELTASMAWLEAQDFGKPLVHIIDREADSAAHWRQWTAAGQRWLTRIKGGSRLTRQDKNLAASTIADTLSFKYARDVMMKGKPARQFVAETTVQVTRKARPKRKNAKGKRVAPERGETLAVRLIVSRVEDAHGNRLAVWYLLSNLDAQAVTGERLALWYYWRWTIESFFKLLKQAGHQLESWEQETGLALFKRLLIASQACVTVWRLMRSPTPQAKDTCAFLVRLSGRQMKRRCPITASAMLDGLFKLLTLLETLETYSIHDLQSFALTAFPNSSLLARKRA
jgi:hypothetical protein